MRATMVAGVAALALAVLVPGRVGAGRAARARRRGRPAGRRSRTRSRRPSTARPGCRIRSTRRSAASTATSTRSNKDRSYLVSFLEHGDVGSGDVHVNFRGYPGRRRSRPARPSILTGKKTIRGKTPCFADRVGTRTAAGITATIYRVNQDADQWHILLAWKHDGSLYTVSEHVITPYTYRAGREEPRPAARRASCSSAREG